MAHSPAERQTHTVLYLNALKCVSPVVLSLSGGLTFDLCVSVDRVGLGGQHGLHLEPSDQRDRSETTRTHRCDL